MTNLADNPPRGMIARVEDFHEVVSEMVEAGYTVERIAFPDLGVTATMTSPSGFPLEVSRWIA